MWGATAGRAVVAPVAAFACKRRPSPREHRPVGRCEHRPRHGSSQCGARPPGALSLSSFSEGKKKPARRAGPTQARQGPVLMWGATAGRAVVAPVAAFACKRRPSPREHRPVGRCEHRPRHGSSRCAPRPPGALPLSGFPEGTKKPARRAGPTQARQGLVSMWGATAGRAVVVVVLGGHEEAGAARRPHTSKTGSCLDVGRARRARCRCFRSGVCLQTPALPTRTSARRPMRASAATRIEPMWGATAGRAVVVVVLGGQKEAGAARRPHTSKTGSCLDVGRDRRARFCRWPA